MRASLAGLDRGLEPRPGEGLPPFNGEWGVGVGVRGLGPPKWCLPPGERRLDIIIAKGGAMEAGCDPGRPGDK